MTFLWINTNLSASSYSEFFERPDVINEQIHKPQFVTESNKDIKTGGMKCNAIAFFLKLLVLL